MKTILIVDQEKNTTFTLQKLLESESFNVFNSQSFREAIVLLNARKFGLAVVNRDMPAAEAFDTVQWLTEYSPETRIITLSSSGSSEVKLQKVIADYPKPLDFFSLVKTIKTSLANNGFSGILSDLSLQDYIQMFCMNGSTKAVLVTQKNEKGIILIRDGNVIYALQDKLEGEKAFFKIMSWKKGTLKEVKIKKFPEQNINKDISFMLLEFASHSTNTSTTEALGNEDQQERRPSSSEETSISAMKPDKNTLKPAGEDPLAYNKDLTGLEKGAVEKRKISGIRGKRPWLKIAMAAILPLLVILVGINSFFLSPGAKSIAATGGGKPLTQAVTEKLPQKIKKGVNDTPAENSSIPPTSGMADSKNAIAVTPLSVSAKTEKMPVASNTTDQGREKNRRVEVWIR